MIRKFLKHPALAKLFHESPFYFSCKKHLRKGNQRLSVETDAPNNSGGVGNDSYLSRKPMFVILWRLELSALVNENQFTYNY